MSLTTKKILIANRKEFKTIQNYACHQHFDWFIYVPVLRFIIWLKDKILIKYNSDINPGQNSATELQWLFSPLLNVKSWSKYLRNRHIWNLVEFNQFKLCYRLKPGISKLRLI